MEGVSLDLVVIEEDISKNAPTHNFIWNFIALK